MTNFNLFVVFITLGFVLTTFSTSDGAVVLEKRSADGEVENTTPAVKLCSPSAPCGWAVYSPLNRRVDYFMKNTCVCPPDKACQKYDDDLGISAYVYRCENRSPDQENKGE